MALGLIAKDTSATKLVDILNKIQKQQTDISSSYDKKAERTKVGVTHAKKIPVIVLQERADDIIKLLKKEMRVEFEKMLDDRFRKHIALRHKELVE